MINKKKLIIIGAGQFGILVSRIINKINRFNITKELIVSPKTSRIFYRDYI